jgi:hypothetical protein
MSNLRYIELSSNYRNRNQWPEPGEFEIPISQSGRKGASTALDPVCLSTPFSSWKIGEFNVNVNPTITLLTETTPIVNSSGGQTVLYVKGKTVGDVLHVVNDYYCNAMLVETSISLRIYSYVYLGGNRGKIIVDGKFIPALPPGTTLTITDPTDFTNILSPYIYIPGPRLQENVLVNKYIYNETRDEYRPLGVYDQNTSLTPIITDSNPSSIISTRDSGSISTWTQSDNVSLRIQPPNPILSTTVAVPFRIQLDQPVLPVNLRTQIFNFDASASHSSNIEGSFLQRLPYYRGVIGPAVKTFQGVDPVTNPNTLVLDSTNIGFYPDGYWVGSIIRIIETGNAPLPPSFDHVIGQEREIVGYNSGTGTIIVYPAFIGDLQLNGLSTYTLYTPPQSRRIEKYVNYKAAIPLGTIPTQTSFEFPLVGSSDKENFYKDLVIKINGEYSSIKSYTIKNQTKTIVLNTPLSVTPNPGDTFSITSGKLTEPFPFTLTTDSQTFVILPFSYDNLNPFVYTGSLVSQQELVCYEVQLLNLVLPNVVLGTASGSLISFYPYIYVALQNVTAAGARLNNIIYSNNPNATRVLFRCPIKDVPNPVNSTFIKIDGSGMVQTIKFRPNDTLFFGVYLPNGEVFTTILNETVSPELPNPVIQISACFSIKRLT